MISATLPDLAPRKDRDSSYTGLSHDEALIRLSQHGPNTLPEP